MPVAEAPSPCTSRPLVAFCEVRPPRLFSGPHQGCFLRASWALIILSASLVATHAVACFLQLFTPFEKIRCQKIKILPPGEPHVFLRRLWVTGRQLSGQRLQRALRFSPRSSLTCGGRGAFGADPGSGVWRFPRTQSPKLSRRVQCAVGLGAVHCRFLTCCTVPVAWMWGSDAPGASDIFQTRAGGEGMGHR